MPTITKRTVKGHTYYYAVRSGRVNGKPRLVWQKYLGTADDIVKLCETAGQPQPLEDPELFRFGAEAAQLHIAEELDIAGIIDGIVPKRKQGLTVGTYILIAAINRGACPKSKRSIGEWFFGSVLGRRFPKVTSAQLASQRFWDNMSLLDPEVIPQIEKKIAKRVIETEGIDIETLIYDTTNFYTFIDTFNDRCEIAKRGINKQKRFDLRQVSLALMVTKDYHVPLFHKCYEGNRVDSESFSSIVDDLVERVKAVTLGCTAVTVVFDRGNNSQAALQKLEESDCHFVGALVTSHCPDLLEVASDQYVPLEDERFAGITAHRTQRLVFGVERSVVVVFSEQFFGKQLRTVLLMREKAEGKLRKLQRQLQAWEEEGPKRGRRPTTVGVEKQVANILKGQHMKELINVVVNEGSKAPILSFGRNEDRLEELTRTLFGKTILFTDQHSWSTQEIVRAFFDKGKVEEAFKSMKDREFSSWFPMFHWTDQKIRIHAFYCVLALLFTSLLHRRANNAGIKISQPKLMEELSGIRQVLHTYPPPGKGRKAPKPQMTLSRRNPTQLRLSTLFDLDKYR